VRVTRPDVTLYTGVSTVYETNLPHAPAGLDSYGVLLGVGGDFRYRSGHTTLEAQYDGVFRRYTGTDLWNVPGHDARVAVSHRVARRWAVGAEAGIQLNGSAEDRVLRDEYTAEANLEYRLTGASRVELYSVYMLKRYPNPTGNNASDPRVGLKYRRVLGARGTWGVGGRYDYNGADSSRHRYNGYTATSDVGFPVGGHHAHLVQDAPLFELLRGLLHLLHVALGAHHDPDTRGVDVDVVELRLHFGLLHQLGDQGDAGGARGQALAPGGLLRILRLRVIRLPAAVACIGLAHARIAAPRRAGPGASAGLS